MKNPHVMNAGLDSADNKCYSTISEPVNPLFCSGKGQFHSNEESSKLKTPYDTITFGQIRDLVDTPQQVEKAQAQWLIPSTLLSRVFKTQETDGEYWLAWCDIDDNPVSIEGIAAIIELLIPDADYEIYASRSATKANQKCRVLIPLSKALSWAEWSLCQEILNDYLQAHGITPDRASERAGQLCYLPNQGKFYKAESKRGGVFLDPMLAFADAIEAKRLEDKKQAEELETRKKAAIERRAALRLPTNSSAYPNTIDTFNDHFTVEDILLRAGYEQNPRDKNLFRHPDSESGNYSASIKDGRVNSLSTSDPLHTNGQGAHHAFSAFCVLFHKGKRIVELEGEVDALVSLGDLDSIVPSNDISDVTDATDVTPNEHGLSSCNVTVTAAVPDVTKPRLPRKDKCPAFVCFDNGIKEGSQSLTNGVWYFDVDKEGEIARTKICSPLHIDAVTYDSQENNYGRLLRFKTTRETWRRWAMPMELLKGSGDELRGGLLAMGVEIQPHPKARTLLSTYLQIDPPEEQIQCALQVGWCGDCFVLPDKVYGQDSDKIHFQSGERGHEEYTQAGTLDGWRDEISVLAVKNPILMIAISAAFAAPLAKKCNAESGGFHFVGDSSIGKSSALEVACSVWGGENFKRSWRTTSNGLEGAAVLFNDCLLALDEISECDPREIGAIVYALGNGRGKQRATRSGNARGVSRWRSFVLSTGERSIATAMNEGGFRSKAGQSVRLLDIPTKRTHGIYDELHGYVSGQALSDSLKKAVTKQYGVVGRAFLEALTNGTQDLSARFHEIKDQDDFKATEPQHKRVAARFALVGLAGELATEYGLTGWPEGAALKSASEGFQLWQNMRGKGNDERQQILEQVSNFIERHEDSRFSCVEAIGLRHIQNKAGWVETVDDTRLYLFNSVGMQEALNGFDFKRSLDVLVEAGVLPQANPISGERATQRRLDGKNHKVYQIDHSKLAEALSSGDEYSPDTH